MKKSMFIWYDEKKDIGYCAEQIKKAGFTHTFLGWKRDDDSRFEQIRLCEKLGLEIESAHTSFENINSMWLEGDDGKSLTDYFVKSIAEAEDCGIPVLIVHLSSTLHITVSVFHAISAYAMKLKKGVSLSLLRTFAESIILTILWRIWIPPQNASASISDMRTSTTTVTVFLKNMETCSFPCISMIILEKRTIIYYLLTEISIGMILR